MDDTLSSNVCSMKDGAVTDPWIAMTTNVGSVAISPSETLVAQGTTASVKDGALTNPWIIETDGVVSGQVTG